MATPRIAAKQAAGLIHLQSPTWHAHGAAEYVWGTGEGEMQTPYGMMAEEAFDLADMCSRTM
eukprot:scaffold77983_cov16-Tisochrysis_lutea.AAC.1